jgi:hypothetical protein
METIFTATTLDIRVRAPKQASGKAVGFADMTLIGPEGSIKLLGLVIVQREDGELAVLLPGSKSKDGRFFASAELAGPVRQRIEEPIRAEARRLLLPPANRK